MKATLATFASLALSLALAAAAGGTQNSLPLSSRVIQRGELRGFGPFRPGADRTLYRTARQWIGLDSSITRAEASAEMTRLRRERFKIGLVEQLGSLQPDRGGLSWVMQLGSAASARAELAAGVRHFQTRNAPPKSTCTAFSVAGIPGARGFHLGGTDSPYEGDNIEFADGPFLYLVGEGWKRGMKSPPQRTALTAAASQL